MSQVRILSPRPFSLGKWSKDENEVRAHSAAPCITGSMVSEIRRRISAHSHRLSGAKSILSPRPFSLGKWSKDENAVRAHDEVPCITAILTPKFPEEETCSLAQRLQGEGSARFNQSDFRRRKSGHWHSVCRQTQSCLPDHFLLENGLRMRTKFERTAQPRVSRASSNQKSGGAFLQTGTE